MRKLETISEARPCVMLKLESRDPCGKMTLNDPDVCDDCLAMLKDAVERGMERNELERHLRKAFGNDQIKSA